MGAPLIWISYSYRWLQWGDSASSLVYSARHTPVAQSGDFVAGAPLHSFRDRIVRRALARHSIEYYFRPVLDCSTRD